MADAKDEGEIREHVIATDPIRTNFHAGPHPQRPIPPDLTVAEKDALANEKRQLIHRRMDRPSGPPRARVLVDPERPAKGVLYTGPSAAEERALATGRSVKDVQAILDAPAERTEAVQAEQRKRRESRRAPAAKAD